MESKVQIPKSVLEDTSLPPRQRFLLVLLASQANSGVVDPDFDALAKLMRMSAWSLERSLHALMQRGMISQFSDGKLQLNLWTTEDHAR